MKKFLFALAMMVSVGSIAQMAKNVNYEKDVVDIAISSEDHTTLVAAVKAANLVETLKGEGPWTIFAPTNDAFADLPDGTVESLLKPENREQLTSILTYHVIADNLDYQAVASALKENDGKVTLTAVNGSDLTVWSKDNKVYVKDMKGNSAEVIAVDLKGSNGVIHVIDSVILPQ